MKEPRFIKKRAERWRELEDGIKQGASKNPEELAKLYIELTDDLAYAETFFPESKTRSYLNNLLLYVHKTIYKNKREKANRFVQFWKLEVPQAIAACRKEIALAFFIFCIGILVATSSMQIDPGFVRSVLGDAYINQTISNIEKGDPMGIYASADETSMFWQITTNNIRVSLIVFAAGILSAFTSGIVLFSNGLMLGAFQYYFYQNNLLGISAQAVWIHGIIEISSIIFCGGAGIALGNAWLYPGNQSRLKQLQIKANQGLKIVVGMIPFFVLAGFIESYFTRYYKLSLLSLSIISVSMILVLFYYFYLPNKSLINQQKND